jgi:hypothetical protein
MSYDDEYDEPDGTCHDCGVDLGADPDGDHDDSHRQCWACWRGEWRFPDTDSGGSHGPEPWRERRPAPGTPPKSVVVGLAALRAQVATLEEAALGAFADVERRLDVLERRVALLKRGRAA